MVARLSCKMADGASVEAPFARPWPFACHWKVPLTRHGRDVRAQPNAGALALNHL
jgi:hypothetical protein